MDLETKKAAVRLLMGKLADVRERFGTLTDKTALHDLQDYGASPEIADFHIARLRYCVGNGVFKSAELRPPNGYAVVSFLIELQNRQMRASAAEQSQNTRFWVDANAAMWLALFKKHSGDYAAAKAEHARLWGKSPVNDFFKSVFNQAYINAKREYESTADARIG